jgi:organic radical activating enzyme
MLKINKNYKDKESLKINSKMFSIHVTNVCNLSCGGCDQFCGYFPKNKNWFIGISDLVDSVNCFISYAKENWQRSDFPEEDKLCLLYGGEPTLHPEFEKIIEILQNDYSDYPFCVYTNGRTFSNKFKDIDLTVQTCREVSRQIYNLENLHKKGYPKFQKIFKRFHTHDKNIAYRIDYKTKDFRTLFAPTLCAPYDIENNKKLSKQDYVNRAKKYCYQWIECECAIYNNKAYACHVAAAMDYMFFDGVNGWNINKNQNPFDKSKEEIDSQLSNFCYRCGYNHENNLIGFENKMQINQYTHQKTLATKTNKITGYEFKIINNPEKIVPIEVFR